MNHVAQFEKISVDQVRKDWAYFLQIYPHEFETCDDEVLKWVYDMIAMPRRATSGSAGYDIVSPIEASIGPEKEAIIPTGLRCRIRDGWFLGLFPRSGLGFKFGVRLMNTVGIVDQDYYYADNEGHILLKLTSDQRYTIHPGDRVAQGIFLPYGITVDDAAKGERHGGFGSTDEEAKHGA